MVRGHSQKGHSGELACPGVSEAGESWRVLPWSEGVWRLGVAATVVRNVGPHAFSQQCSAGVLCLLRHEHLMCSTSGSPMRTGIVAIPHGVMPFRVQPQAATGAGVL